MRIKTSKQHGSYLIRYFGKDYVEKAYVAFSISGLEAQIEFPSDWHEEARGWVRIGLGLFRFAISFPWKWVVPDNYQCSGPQYGFVFFERSIHVHYGKDKCRIYDMPWAWAHIRHQVIDTQGKLVDYHPDYAEVGKDPDGRKLETYPFTYILHSGKIQERKATIYISEREWRWKWLQWLPYPKIINTCIEIDFDDEVGERTGSWKGGTVGCSYELFDDETPYECLMRMQKERKF